MAVVLARDRCTKITENASLAFISTFVFSTSTHSVILRQPRADGPSKYASVFISARLDDCIPFESTSDSLVPLSGHDVRASWNTDAT